MDKQLSVRRPVSMYPQEWDMVERVNERYGLKNTSAALRFIVNEFKRLTEDSSGVVTAAIEKTQEGNQ